jgi:hypothetical protein
MSVLETMKVYIVRGSRRVTLNWPCLYRGPHDEGWVECRVVDLSLGGAALDIAIPAGEPHGRVTLALHDQDGHPIGLDLAADVSYWKDGSAPGRLRVGVRFVNVTPLQRYMLGGLTSRERRR